MKKMTFIALTVISSGCFGSMMDHSAKIEKSIRQQAAFDLGCDEGKLQLQKMDAPMGLYKYGVTGCGKKTSYNGGCDNIGSCNVARGGEIQTTE
jgi:hypothetical protein